MTLRWLFPLLQKFRSLGPQQFAAALLPISIDELLYSIDVTASTPSDPPNSDFRIERFDVTRVSNNPQIDSRLSGTRTCYLIQVDGAIAHQSWLSFAVLLPSQFGFDGATPVIGECYTNPAYRGRAMYTTVLKHIVADVASRQLADSIFILVSPDNAPSIRGIERAGFRLQGRLRGRRVLGLLTRRSIKSNRGSSRG